jgi:hypothetical protein
MDPEALQILKRVERYLNVVRFFVLLNVFLAVMMIVALLVGYFYVKNKADDLNHQVDSKVQGLQDKIPSTDSFRFR